jgi:D-alanine transaminase
MSRIIYVNGRYRPASEAFVAVDDRAHYFGDGVYEGVQIKDGRLIDEARHLERLGRSLAAVRIEWPMAEAALRGVMREVARRNRVRDGFLYLQISRGVARRDHGFPKAGVRPSLTVTAKSLDPRINESKAARGVKVITVADQRWSRPDIKSLNLLPNVLAKQAARERGAEEAWLVDDHGFVTEGSSTNAWIVTRDGALVTRQTDHSILPGVTRKTLIEVAAALGLGVEIRPFTVDEAFRAREAFFSSSSTVVIPVVEIDDRVIGDGRPGQIALALRKRFHEIATKS